MTNVIDANDRLRQLGKEIGRKQLEESVKLIPKERPISVGDAISELVASMYPRKSLANFSDYFAHRIVRDLSQPDPEGIIESCKDLRTHLHPTQGYLVTCDRALEVIDRNGKRYRLTIEEVKEAGNLPCDVEPA